MVKIHYTNNALRYTSNALLVEEVETECGRRVPSNKATNIQPPAWKIRENPERYCKQCFGHGD